MLGTILFIDDNTGTAIIRADDGKRYRFPVSDWPGGAALSAGVRADFDVDGDRALAPFPVTAAVAEIVAKPAVTPVPPAIAPPPAPAPAPAPVVPAKPAPVAKLTGTKKPAAKATPEPVPTPPADPVTVTVAVAPPVTPSVTAAPIDVAGANTDPIEPTRPISPASGDAPDYVTMNQDVTPDDNSGLKGILVVGGAVLLLAFAALAYMMWDNGEAAGVSEIAATTEASTLFAQEDLPVRNTASMTNSTVLGRIARGDRVTGVEVAGASDPQSRWLRLDGGNRFIPMTGLSPAAPPAIAVAPPEPVIPVAPPTAPDDGNYEETYGRQGGDYRADRDGPIDAVPPVRPAPPPRRVTPPPPRRITPPPPRRIPQPPPRRIDPRETPAVGDGYQGGSTPN